MEGFRCELYADPNARDGQYSFPRLGRPHLRVVIGVAGETFRAVLEVLMHEIGEAAAVNQRLTLKSDITLSHVNASDNRVFLIKHRQYTEWVASTSYVVEAVYNKLKQVWQNVQKKEDSRG
jgi:hypothetical protein